MEEDTELQLDSRLSCHVCGEQQFTLREGFYYCQECGTKQEQVRAVEVDREQQFAEGKHAKKQKIRKLKMEESELTSWECYNYILRGMVEDLLGFGAKEELKLMALQVWAAYLRQMEVAFFDKNHSELPRLGVCFLKRDARTLYSYGVEKAKKRKRRQTVNSSLSGAESGRAWRKSKRKLDASIYSLHSSLLSSDPNQTQSSANTSSTGTTTHAVPLRFSMHARKYLKKLMPAQHLKKHELDFDLTCHKLKPPTNVLKSSEWALHTMNIRQVYGILAIALNLVEDNFQLSDLVRFIADGHISTKNVRNYFPENVLPKYKKILHEIQFNMYPEKYSDKALRYHASLLAKHLKIRGFIAPDLMKLVERYVSDLNLPADVATYVERLITLLPPQMRTRVPHMYPAYEARAMAYVVFVLKLLFGLDGYKEKLISESAAKVNQHMRKLSDAKKSNTISLSPLFVWSEWVEFVEMRKVIVSHYNSSFCRQFNQCQSTAQLLEELAGEDRCRIEEEELVTEHLTVHKTKVATMKSIFQQFLECHHALNTAEQVEAIKFAPSFVPSHSYFKRILLHCSSSTKAAIKIPEFMRVDHTQRTLEPFLQSNLLRQYFEQYELTLDVLRVPCTSRRCYVGVFRPPIDRLNFSSEYRENENRTKTADFNISEEQWRKNLVEEALVEELEFKTKLDNYKMEYFKKKLSDDRKRKQHQDKGMPDWLEDNQTQLQQNIATPPAAAEDQVAGVEAPMPPPTSLPPKAVGQREEQNLDVLSRHSFDVFSECNMEPIPNWTQRVPRRNLNSVQVFGEYLDDDETIEVETTQDELVKKHMHKSESDKRRVTLVTSKMDCWLLLGTVHQLSSVQKKCLENKFAYSFFWLLETCAQTIGVDWCVLYEQLLAIELMYAYGVEDLNSFKDCIRFKYINPIKDLNLLVNLYREIW